MRNKEDAAILHHDEHHEVHNSHYVVAFTNVVKHLCTWWPIPPLKERYG